MAAVITFKPTRVKSAPFSKEPHVLRSRFGQPTVGFRLQNCVKGSGFMAVTVILPASATRADAVELGERYMREAQQTKPKASQPLMALFEPSLRLKSDSEGSGFTMIEMLLPSKLAWAASVEVTHRFIQTARKPKPVASRRRKSA